jgi:hypothetical protein
MHEVARTKRSVTNGGQTAANSVESSCNEASTWVTNCVRRGHGWIWFARSLVCVGEPLLQRGSVKLHHSGAKDWIGTHSRLQSRRGARETAPWVRSVAHSLTCITVVHLLASTRTVGFIRSLAAQAMCGALAHSQRAYLGTSLARPRWPVCAQGLRSLVFTRSSRPRPRPPQKQRWQGSGGKAAMAKAAVARQRWQRQRWRSPRYRSGRRLQRANWIRPGAGCSWPGSQRSLAPWGTLHADPPRTYRWNSSECTNTNRTLRKPR